MADRNRIVNSVARDCCLVQDRRRTNPKWLGYKVGLYALAVGCGIAIRFRLRPFTPAFARLMATGSTPQIERDLRDAIVGSQPFVAAIWPCVVGAALLGLPKPGASV